MSITSLESIIDFFLANLCGRSCCLLQVQLVTRHHRVSRVSYIWIHNFTGIKIIWFVSLGFHIYMTIPIFPLSRTLTILGSVPKSVRTPSTRKGSSRNRAGCLEFPDLAHGYQIAVWAFQAPLRQIVVQVERFIVVLLSVKKSSKLRDPGL